MVTGTGFLNMMGELLEQNNHYRNAFIKSAKTADSVEGKKQANCDCLVLILLNILQIISYPT